MAETHSQAGPIPRRYPPCGFLSPQYHTGPAARRKHRLHPCPACHAFGTGPPPGDTAAPVFGKQRLTAVIVRDRPGLVTLFLILRGSVIQRIWPQMLLVMALSLAVVLGHAIAPGLIPTVNGAPFALVGIALSVFLGFRNNACYDRWWEARKVLGNLVTYSRDLIRRTQLLPPRGPAGVQAREVLLRQAVIFAQALAAHVRPPAGLSPPPHPDQPLQVMGDTLAALRSPAAPLVSDVEYTLLDRTVSDMTGVLTACERLRNTPVPFGYMLLLHRTAYLFCFMLPFGFADVLGLATPLAAGVVAYTFFGLDSLSEELEEPFGTLPNDLPVAALAVTVERTLRAALGDTDLPPAPQPVEGILL